MSNKGFTLIELMIYSAILMVVSTLLVSVLSVVTRIAGTENASSEIANQGNFIMQTIQRLVRESSLLEVPNPTTLVIYPSNYTTSSTTVILSGTNINLTDASGVSNLNTSKVSITGLVFKKLSNNSNAGALDVVGVDLILSYNSTSPGQALVRTLSTAVSRASAATFDTGIFPNVGNSLDVGTAGTRWANGYFSNGNFSGNLTVTSTVGLGGVAAPISPIVLEVNGGIRINTVVSKPVCALAYRGMFWVVQAAAGVKDNVEVCAKDAANAYAWRTIY